MDESTMKLDPAYLTSTTICEFLSRHMSGPRSAPGDSQRQVYAGS
jgi:hypothetical protein